MTSKTSKTDIRPGDEIDVVFETLAQGGACKGTPVGAAKGSASIFTHLAAPQDEARVRVTSVKKNYINAELIEVTKPSPLRVEPKCPVFSECGGCDWQHLSYSAQLAASDEILEYTLRRSLKARGEIRPTRGSPNEYGYRTRGDFALSVENGKVLFGFRKRKSHEIVSIRACPQFVPAVSGSIEMLRDFLSARRWEEGAEHRVRVVYEEEGDRLAVIPERKDGEEVSEVFVIDRRTGRIVEEGTECVFSYGIGSFRIEYHPSCFTQINAGVNELLVTEVADLVSPESHQTILELYSGIGNFTLPLARTAGLVLSVERFGLSHTFAKHNAEQYAPLPILHFAQSARSVCRKLIIDKKRIDAVVADPPRAGLGEDVCEGIVRLRPPRIVYVSCDRKTFAEDARRLEPSGYRLKSVTPFDMFPQTHHKEIVGLFEPG